MMSRDTVMEMNNIWKKH